MEITKTDIFTNVVTILNQVRTERDQSQIFGELVVGRQTNSYSEFNAFWVEYRVITGDKNLMSSSTKIAEVEFCSLELVSKRVLFLYCKSKLSGCGSWFWYQANRGFGPLTQVNMKHSHVRAVANEGKSNNHNKWNECSKRFHCGMLNVTSQEQIRWLPRDKGKDYSTYFSGIFLPLYLLA